jgi:hypothetical protein
MTPHHFLPGEITDARNTIKTYWHGHRLKQQSDKTTPTFRFSYGFRWSCLLLRASAYRKFNLRNSSHTHLYTILISFLDLYRSLHISRRSLPGWGGGVLDQYWLKNLANYHCCSLYLKAKPHVEQICRPESSLQGSLETEGFAFSMLQLFHY